MVDSKHLVICLDQLLASKSHTSFNLRNKITEKFVGLLISIFLHGIFVHCLILLPTWRRISQVIDYGWLYFSVHAFRASGILKVAKWGFKPHDTRICLIYPKNQLVRSCNSQVSFNTSNVRVLFNLFFMFANFYQLDLGNNLYYISKYTIKYQIKIKIVTWTSLDLIIY